MSWPMSCNQRSLMFEYLGGWYPLNEYQWSCMLASVICQSQPIMYVWLAPNCRLKATANWPESPMCWLFFFLKLFQRGCWLCPIFTLIILFAIVLYHLAIIGNQMLHWSVLVKMIATNLHISIIWYNINEIHRGRTTKPNNGLHTHTYLDLNWLAPITHSLSLCVFLSLRQETFSTIPKSLQRHTTSTHLTVKGLHI